MKRKEYAAPAIAWEDVLEQTSLACQATQPYPMTGVCFAGVSMPFASGAPLECTFSVAKGGAFGKSCDTILLPEQLREPVVLS
jgi:hypothetical protein